MRRFASLSFALTLFALTPILVLPGCTSTEPEPGRMDGGDVILEAEIERRVSEIPFLHGVQLVHNLERLARIGEPAVPHLVEALRDERPAVRSSVAWTLGVMGDRRRIPALQEVLDDRVGFVRYEAASSLVELGDSSGFPVLVEGLASSRIDDRYKCFEALREVTGQDFGYRHDAAPPMRKAAVARWLDWLEGIEASAL